MDSSPAESSGTGAAAAIDKKRKRVSRACDACFAKKDRCDGARPLCKVCKNLGRPCTYNRPERKRGPSQGVRQRLESQIESLESLLGYLADAYPQVGYEAVKHLRLDEAEATLLDSARQFGSSYDHVSSPNSWALQQQRINVYPQCSKSQAREMWRTSTLAKAVAPSLGLNLAIDEEEEEMLGADWLRVRIDEARRARVRIRSGMPMEQTHTTSQGAPHHHHHHQQQQQQHQQQQVVPHPPYPQVMQQQPSSTFPTQTLYASAMSHLPPLAPQQFAPGKKTPGWSYPSARNSPRQVSVGPELQHLPHSYPYQPQNQSHRSPAPVQHRPTNEPMTSAPIMSHIETHAAPTPTNLANPYHEDASEALAYALGLTSYAASPQKDAQHHRHTSSTAAAAATIAATPPQASHQTSQHWIHSPFPASDSQGFAATSHRSHQMHPHPQPHGGHMEEEGQQSVGGLDFFSDFDLSHQPNDNDQLSVLHQLGLQGGGFDMPTPVQHSTEQQQQQQHQLKAEAAALPHNTGPVVGHGPGRVEGTSHTAPTNSSHWLQPIRGIN